MRHVVLALLFASLPAAAHPAAAPAAAVPADLDAYVARAMRSFEVPGLALAVVKDDTVVVAKGYGVRRLGAQEPVDAHTLFAIASNTKAFTATALGMLVEEGRIAWDAPVVSYLPQFQMWDPWVTRELTVRDLLVHRSGLGLGAGDLLWWPPSRYDRKEILRRLRFIRPVTSFRTAYAYDNVLYIVAGELVEAVSGRSWEDFIGERVLARVGMADSIVMHSSIAAAGNIAAPHARVGDAVRPIAPFVGDATNPAGGVSSSATDMARWLRVQLASGRLPDGSRLFSEATARELTSLVTPIVIDEQPPELAALTPQFAGYALGFHVRDYRGHKIVTHGGVLPGYVSRVLMVPGARLGLAVLTNQESEAAYDAIAYHVVDHVLGLPASDWIGAFGKVRERELARSAAAERAAAVARNAASRPSLPLAAYAGRYRDDWYGDVEIALEDGRLVMRFAATPVLVGDLGHWQYDTFVVIWRDRELRADAFVGFSLRPDGSIEQAKMQAISPATDFSFNFQDLVLRRAPLP